MRISVFYALAVVLGIVILAMPYFRVLGEFYGSEIYSLALDYPKLANHTVLVEGVLVGSGKDVVLEGTVSGAGRGYLVVETKTRNYTVGGPLAGREDVAAKRIVLVD